MLFTYSQPITKVVQAIPHNDHPGKGSYPSILEMLDRVCMSVCVSVGMMVLRVVVMENMVVVVVMVMLLV